jgi:hypothetical protein
MFGPGGGSDAQARYAVALSAAVPAPELAHGPGSQPQARDGDVHGHVNGR